MFIPATMYLVAGMFPAPALKESVPYSQLLRSADQVTLRLITIVVKQEFELLAVLHPLGHHGQAQLVGQTDHATDQRGVFWTAIGMGDE